MDKPFKKGDIIERFDGDPVIGIKNGVKLTFDEYLCFKVKVKESPYLYSPKNFRKWVEINPKPVKSKQQVTVKLKPSKSLLDTTINLRSKWISKLIDKGWNPELAAKFVNSNLYGIDLYKP